MSISLKKKTSKQSLIFKSTATYGARPMARLIQTEILNPLSRLLLQGRVRDGEIAHVTVDLRKNRLVVIPNHEPDVTQPDDSEDEDDSMDIEVEEMD